MSVYLDNQPLVLGVDFVVDPYIGTPRTITLADLPDVGSQILISVRTNAQYYISGNTLTWQPTGGLTPGPGDVISVTTWNNTFNKIFLHRYLLDPHHKASRLASRMTQLHSTKEPSQAPLGHLTLPQALLFKPIGSIQVDP